MYTDKYKYVQIYRDIYGWKYPTKWWKDDKCGEPHKQKFLLSH